MHTLTRRGVAIAGALALSVALAACGGETNSITPGEEPTSNASATVSAQRNDADVEFAQGMIAHHKGAIDMAEIAENKATSAEVKALASKIKAAQAPEIETMTSWLTAWDQEVSDDHASMGHGSEMPGMASDEEMARFEAATGTDFDRMFLELMTKHHEGAIEMARTEQADGENPEALALAAKIQVDQGVEIDEMRGMLQAL